MDTLSASAPISYRDQELTNYFNLQPSEVKGRANIDTEYWKRILYTKVYSVLEFKLPENIPLNYFRFWLFHFGSIAIIYTSEYGWIAQPYGIEKLDLYYQPKVINVSNQNLDEIKTGVVGYNCGIVKLMDDYFGLDDIVTRYATQLASLDKAFNVNLANCNTTFMAEVDNKKQADAVKEAYGEASTGKPLVVVGKKALGDSGITTMFPSAKNNYIGDQLLTARRTIINQFLTEIGIKNANYDKKERLNSQEVEQNNDETKAIISVIFENILTSFSKINKISGLDLSVSYNYDYNEDGDKEGDDEDA